PAPSARRERRRRVGHRRRAAGHRQRGGRCALAPRRDAHRHPDHAREGVDPAESEGRCRVRNRGQSPISVRSATLMRNRALTPISGASARMAAVHAILRRHFVLRRIACCALLALLPLASSAADYPSKPVKWVVPYPPGGTTDLLARWMANWLSDKMGQQFIIENKPGGGNNIGVEYVE